MAIPPKEHRAKIAEARNVLGEVISRARYAGEPTVLINRGKEAAVIVGYDFYEQALRDRAIIDELHRRTEPTEDATSPEKVKARQVREALHAAALTVDS